MNRIATKQDFYKLSRKLILGNILEQWDWPTFKTIMQSNPGSLPKIVGVRHVRKAFTNKGTSGLMERTEALKYGMKTSDKENLLFDEGAVHDHLTIQGEALADYEGLYVRYSHLQCHQRTLWHIDHNGVWDLEAHQLPRNMEILTGNQIKGTEPVVQHVRGLQAVMLMRHYMDASSWDKFSDLLNCQLENPDSEFNFEHPVIEFACFDCRVGQLKWNSLFWEVRTDY